MRSLGESSREDHDAPSRNRSGGGRLPGSLATDPSPITVVVADEEEGRREACLRVLATDTGIRVVAQAGSARETLRSARLVPRILLVDAGLALREGSALLPTFHQRSPATRVIVLAGRTFGDLLLPALALGAQGYLNRRLLRVYLPKAVRTVDSGEPWVSRRLLPRIIDTLMRLGATPGPSRERR
jgi:DNA-binding NarL/FixJ family response regulator